MRVSKDPAPPMKAPNSVPDWVLHQPRIANKEMLADGGDVYIEWVTAGGLWRATLVAVVREGVFTAADLDWSDAHIELVRRASDCKRCGGYGYIIRPGYDPAGPSPTWPIGDRRERCACATEASETAWADLKAFTFNSLTEALKELPDPSTIPQLLTFNYLDWLQLQKLPAEKPFRETFPASRGITVTWDDDVRPGQVKVTYADGHTETKETTT